MREQDLDLLFAALERPVRVDPVFADRVFARLVAEQHRSPTRRVWLAVLAAAVVGVAAGAVVLGGGGLGFNVAVAPTASADISATPVPTADCPPPPLPQGSVRVGCILVQQTYTFSLDKSEQTAIGADLFFEAATETAFYLTRSYDWPGPMTQLRLSSRGGRSGCLAALDSRDPGATAWPIQTDPKVLPDSPHGIPFTALTPATTICVTSLGEHVYEVHLARLIPDGLDTGHAIYLAEFTWIDWGPIG
jgi:hypothetical protein